MRGQCVVFHWTSLINGRYSSLRRAVTYTFLLSCHEHLSPLLSHYLPPDNNQVKAVVYGNVGDGIDIRGCRYPFSQCELSSRTQVLVCVVPVSLRLPIPHEMILTDMCFGNLYQSRCNSLRRPTPREFGHGFCLFVTRHKMYYIFFGYWPPPPTSQYMYICLSVFSVYLSVYLSVCLSVCLYVFVSICLSACLPACLTTYLDSSDFLCLLSSLCVGAQTP